LEYSFFIITLLFTFVIAFFMGIGYYVGRKSRAQDIEYICDQILEGVTVEQASKYRLPRARYERKRRERLEMFDPVMPDVEPVRKKGDKEGVE